MLHHQDLRQPIDPPTGRAAFLYSVILGSPGRVTSLVNAISGAVCRILVGAGIRCRPLRVWAFLFPAICPFPLTAQTTTVLVEAESFAAPGGWRADTQSVEQMGSVYLLAHGLGRPVTDAVTTVTLPHTGSFRVWVRTRNWVPGEWAPPGRFKVAINGADLAPTFGTEAASWHWQDGGTVEFPTTSATLTLKDLTGFAGRCDALALIHGSDQPPPQDLAQLKAWRRTVMNEAPAPADVREFDCVIAGGGIAGCSAALAAARSGVRVALVHDRPVLGGNASQEIRVATRGQIRHPIVDKIDTLPLTNRADGTVAADASRLAKIQAEPNLTLLQPWRAEDAGTDPASGRITHVDARHTLTGARVRLRAGLFIDCTGDGWLGWWAEADFRMGSESRSEFGETLGKPTADATTMGNSLMWKSKVGLVDSTFPAVPWAMEVAGTRADTGGDWNWEYGMQLNTITDSEAIRDHLLRAIYGNFANAKKAAANSKLELDWVPFIAGKRESRRLLGDHILTQQDMVEGAFFEDAVGTTDWGIDLHFETGVSYLSGFAKTNIASPCYFPFRSLYSRNVPNLMMAGRCFSCTHVGLGSPRVMNTTGQMGVATGYAAAICTQYQITPRQLYRSTDRTLELQARIGGVWPARPVVVNTVVDNTDAAAVSITGDWTAGTSPTGFVGSNFLHDGNTGQGTKQVAFIPQLPVPGKYDVSLRWTAGADRSSATPVWVITQATPMTVATQDLTSIRNTLPAQVQNTRDIWLGRYAPNDFSRGLLRFPLTSLPAGSVIQSATLVLTIAGPDPASTSGPIGAEGIKLYQLGEACNPAAASWNQRDNGSAWTTAGGTFSSSGPVASIAVQTDPNLVKAGELFTFANSPALAAAVRAASASGAPLHLLVRTPSVESSYNARKLYHFSSAKLHLKLVQPTLPATHVIDQRTNGGKWVGLGNFDIPADGVAVVIGNHGADGYVIADAVQFSPPAAGDRDADGLPDWWERANFSSETAAEPSADPDRDGRSNQIEYLTGCDPNDAGSWFNARIAIDGPAPSMSLRWPAAEGSRYFIESSPDCINWTPLIEGIAATPPENFQTVPITATARFFRVGIAP